MNGYTAWAWRVVARCPGRAALRRLIVVSWPRSGSTQAPAERQRERERVRLTAIHAMELEPRACRVLEHLRSGTSQIAEISS
jgi:hypothetical protein